MLRREGSKVGSRDALGAGAVDRERLSFSLSSYTRGAPYFRRPLVNPSFYSASVILFIEIYGLIMSVFRYDCLFA